MTNAVSVGSPAVVASSLPFTSVAVAVTPVADTPFGKLVVTVVETFSVPPVKFVTSTW